MCNCICLDWLPAICYHHINEAAGRKDLVILRSRYIIIILMKREFDEA